MMNDPFKDVLQEPDFARGFYNEQIGGLGSQNKRDYYKGQFDNFFSKFQLQLGRMLESGQDTNQLSFDSFLKQQPFDNQYAALPPELAGRLTGRFAPQVRWYQ